MSELPITLHPQASDFLFKYFRVVSRVFSDILGLLEIDYMSIALLTGKQELLFFSSRPSIEWKMIEQDRWRMDGRLQREFLMQEQMKIWEEKPKEFLFGYSISSIFSGDRVVYSFASKSYDAKDCERIIDNSALLLRMGKFSLKKILATIELPVTKNDYIQKPPLRLVINNKVSI